MKADRRRRGRDGSGRRNRRMHCGVILLSDFFPEMKQINRSCGVSLRYLIEINQTRSINCFSDTKNI